MSESQSQLQPVIFGEVLFDCFPDNKQVLGGAPFNVAWNLRSLGFDPIFVSRVGKDDYGRKIQDAMSNWGMRTDFLQSDEQHPTGVVSVSFNDGEPAYDIVENSAWDFVTDSELKSLPEVSLLYHGTLGLRHAVSASTLSKLKQTISGKVFLDVNLRPPYWNRELIQQQFHECHYLKLNEDELALLASEDGTVVEQARALSMQYGIQRIFVTLGKNGAIAVDKQGEYYQVKPATELKVVDTVGAGDAFSSVLIMGILLDWDVSTMMDRAQAFAGAIVGLQGATTENKAFYQQFSKDWS